MKISDQPWSILNRAKVYVPAANTDLKATFARIRKEQAKAAEVPKNVRTLKLEKK